MAPETRGSTISFTERWLSWLKPCAQGHVHTQPLSVLESVSDVNYMMLQLKQEELIGSCAYFKGILIDTQNQKLLLLNLILNNP